MKKVLILFLSLFVALTLAACGSESEEKEIGEVDSEGEKQSEQEEVEASSDSEESEAAEESEEVESSTYDEVLLDNDDAMVSLQGIETIRDETFGDEYKIKLTIENKLDETIEVQAHEVSLDGLMVDDMVFFSETVAGGKKSNAELSIMALDEELPELNENLEFKLMILDESFETLNDSVVSIDIK